MTLDKANVGDTLSIAHISDHETELMAMRLGICKGEKITVCSKVPAGPLVVRRGHMEIALGREVCKKISVMDVNA